jgi:hypothetical protein
MLGSLLSTAFLVGIIWGFYRYPLATAIVLALFFATFAFLILRDKRIQKRRLADLNSEDESLREKAVTDLREDLGIEGRWWEMKVILICGGK